MLNINIMSQKELKRNLVLIGFLLIVAGIILLLPKTFSAPVPIESVEITSEKLNYTKKDPGSFNIEKSAEWIARGKARITFDVDTIVKSEDRYRDIIFVLDISGSMEGDKLTRVKQDSIDLINSLLSDTNNRAALITFESTSQLVLPLTNDRETIVNTINSLTTGNNTNYYKPLLNVDEILKNYKKESNRECIVLFLTDGYPNEDIPNEEGQYKYLKSEYPYLIINGVQYEMGNDVLEPIKKVSDRQFIADMTNLNNVLFEASVAPIMYNNFEIIDYINNDYFEIDSIDSINASIGTTKLDYENGTPKVIWNINNLATGSKPKLTIDVNLKKEFLNTGGLYPTNKKEKINVVFEEVKEDITSSKTPILPIQYQVIYDANIPDGCTLEGEVPEIETRKVFDRILISDKKLVCDNYQFKEWSIVTKNVKKINKDYFEMPNNDVLLRAVWTSFSTTKAMDGEIYTTPPSILKQVSWSDTEDIWKYRESIKKVIFENNIHEIKDAIESFDISEKADESVMAHVLLNDDDSTYTVYIQGNGRIIGNLDSSYIFYGFSNLESIEGMEYFDTTNVQGMAGMFWECKKLTNIDLSHFDTSQVILMYGMFYKCYNLTSLDLSSFDTSNVLDMRHMFSNVGTHMTSIDLSNFNTSKVVSMEGMFADAFGSLDTLDLSSFDTSNVESMKSMFQGCNFKKLDLSNFNTSKVTNMWGMFYACEDLISLDVSNFDTSNVENMYWMFNACKSLLSLDVSSFRADKLTNMQGMFSWCEKIESIKFGEFNTSHVENMQEAFYACKVLASLDISSFDTGNVTNMNYMFSWCLNLTDLNLGDFDTSKVTGMNSMFYLCKMLRTTITIRGTVTKYYNEMISSTAASEGSLVIINYTEETSDLVDEMIATKASVSNVIKGELVS